MTSTSVDAGPSGEQPPSAAVEDDQDYGRAGIPLDPSFEEQKNIMLRCKGVFYACKDGAEARRFNRLLIEAGFIKGL